MVVHRLLSVILGISAFGGTVLAQVESTGFEAEDGWVAGYSICGPEFAATCSYPVTNACVPDDHVASQNCCEGDPNEQTGWYMAGDSGQCNEPHIDTANPFTGLQHLRFQRDPAGGNQGATAMTPRLPAQAPQHTVVSFEKAGAAFRFEVYAEDDPFGLLAARVYLGYESVTVVDFCEPGYYAPAFFHLDGAYHNFTIDFDPVANTIRHCYAGNTILVTKFRPNRPRTVQGASFQTYFGFVDVDDFSIARGTSAPVTCREFPTECQTPCGPRPCVLLKAVAVNGESIAPTTDVYVRPGDVIETELFFSGWGGNMPEVRGFEVQLGLLEGATSGVNGTVLPLGWDAPVTPVFCTNNANCPSAYPICMETYLGGFCVGPSHDPGQGVYIDINRADFILSGQRSIVGTSTLILGGIKYWGFFEDIVGMLDQGVPRYAGTLLLDVSEDACGTFSLQFYSPDDTPTVVTTFLFDTSIPPEVFNPWLSSLQVHVCEDDGLFCNGLQSCDSESCVITPPPDCNDGNECTDDYCDEDADACGHVVVCGACCDPWIGDCQDYVDEADCTCPNCVWTGGAQCADVECKAEFVVIPAVSEWGLVVLTLLLLTGGKVLFRRLSANPI